ncbi:MAG TPA: pentapeptide repeat-containing protein [Patescibacteria group bacterium]
MADHQYNKDQLDFLMSCLGSNGSSTLNRLSGQRFGFGRNRSDWNKARKKNAWLACLNFRMVDLARRDLSGLDFEEGRFDGADLSGTDFTNASLAGADLTGAIINNQTNFRGADLRGAKVDHSNGGNFEGAIFE